MENGWPQADIGPDNLPRGFNTNVVLADIDHDSKLEVITGGRDFNLYIWRYDGTFMPGWPQTAVRSLSRVSVADLHNDGTLEVMAGDSQRIYVWDAISGVLLDGWPQFRYIQKTYSVNFSSPAIADIDQDGTAEILIGGRSYGKLFGFELDGTELDGFPKNLFSESLSDPAIDDIDNDGYVEILTAAKAGIVQCWEAGIRNPQRSYWPMGQHDPQHTGVYTKPPLIPGDFDGEGDVDQNDYDTFESCASGPAIPHSGSQTCQQADFDDDNDVDQDDFAIFQRCYSGQGNLANPNCAD
jgi:hypothetical protein